MTDRRPPEIEDLRGRRRYTVDPPVPVQFGTLSATLRDASDKGVQIEHAAALKLGIVAPLSMPQNRQLPPLRAKVIWSRLSRTPDATGKYLYRTGVVFLEDSETNQQLLDCLVRQYGARVDESSLERKRQANSDRATQRAAKPVLKPIVQRDPEIASDTVLLIQHARDRLRTHPDEAIKWYNRAKFSAATTGEILHANRDEILAVWEYLERSIDVELIAKVFERQK